MVTTYRLGSDIGGTFTDFVVIDIARGEISAHKCLTTPHDPSEAVMDGIQVLEDRLAGFMPGLELNVHATTLAINAVIERKGAPTGLLTTAGFRDILEMRRHTRTHTYDLWGDPPPALVPRIHRLEVTERVCSDGRVLVPLDLDEVRLQVQGLDQMGVQSVAVSLLHAYVNPIHERQIKKLIQNEFPRLYISCSSDVLPAIKEYERTSATAINAYIKPVMNKYLDKIERGLASAGCRTPLFVMLSSGGLAGAATAREYPVRVIESGPIGGVIAARYFGSNLGADEIMAFDMGGTTAKGCLIRHGDLPISAELEIDRRQRFRKGSGLPVGVPTVDLIEIGAGGGSIAMVNRLGLVQVGPESAGATPGPICYGRGGTKPTVTDADLILGYLNPEYFLGGDMALDLEGAHQGLATDIGDRLGIDALAAAWKIHDVVNENMASAITMHITERGCDPARSTLVAFGGAGPVHAFNLARKLGVTKLLIPFAAGVMSALGLMIAPISYHMMKTHKVNLRGLDFGYVARMFSEMEQEAAVVIREAVPTAGIRFIHSLEICFHGQSYQINTILPTGRPIDEVTEAEVVEIFRAEYIRLYGYVYDDVPMEVVNLRLVADADQPLYQLTKRVQEPRTPQSQVKGHRLAFSGESRCQVMHTVYDRYTLRVGDAVVGPAIIEERESTLVVGEGGRAEITPDGSILVTLSQRV